MSQKKPSVGEVRSASALERAAEPPGQSELFAPHIGKKAVRRRDQAAAVAPTKASSSSTKAAPAVLQNPPQATPPLGANLVVRDTFSMPPDEHLYIEMLRVRAAREGRIISKSEVVRAGLVALAGLKPVQLVALLDGLEKVKPGRR